LPCFFSVPLKLIGRIPFPDYRKFTEQQAKDMIAAVTKLLGAYVLDRQAAKGDARDCHVNCPKHKLHIARLTL
jgi:hypothetical protein